MNVPRQPQTSQRRRTMPGWTTAGAFVTGAALIAVSVTACATDQAASAVNDQAIPSAIDDPDFSANGPLVTSRIVPDGAHWADSGEHELNLQSPQIHTVFREETRNIPLPPGATYNKTYGKWISILTSPGMTQHTRTEIRAEATGEAVNVWFRYWLSATPAERKATATAMEQVTTSPYLDRTLGDVMVPFAPETVRAKQTLAAASAGHTAPMQEWIQQHSF